MIEDLLRDVRFGLRMLAKSPGFTVTAVVTLALGIGANTAIFSIFDQVMLRLLPVKNPRELVLVDVSGPQMEGWSSADSRHRVHSYPTYLDLKNRGEMFAGVIARAPVALALAHDGGSERADGELVSGDFFRVLGVQPYLGRLIQEEDDRLEGAHPVAVLGFGCWQSRFGGREDILNQKITLNTHPMVVVGVTPPGFRGVLSGRSPDVYIPLSMRKQMWPAFYRFDASERRLRNLNVLARLRPGVNAVQAEAATQSVYRGIVEEILTGVGSRPNAARLRQEYLSKKVQLIPAHQGIPAFRESVEEPLAWLGGMAFVVLLIACVNVAGLLVTRSMARRREIAVRLALGSSRGALARQLLTESLLLAVLGGVAGLLVAGWVAKLLIQLSPAGENTLTAELDARVLGFNFLVATITGLAFGLAPVWTALRTSVVETLKAQSASAGQERWGVNFRKIATVTQVALSLVLLVAAGLFAKTLYNLQNFDPGFSTDSILTFRLDPQLSGYDLERGRRLYEELLRRFRQLPAVETAGAALIPLLADAERGGSVTVEGYRGEHKGCSRNQVSTDFFRAVGIPVVLGRTFAGRDQRGSPKIAVVNETFVRAYSEGENPIGKRLAFQSGTPKLDVEIVGVVRDIRPGRLRSEVKPLVYTPFFQEKELPSLTFYLRTRREDELLSSQVRRIAGEIDSQLPVSDMRTMGETRDRAVSLERTVSKLSGAFGMLATFLAAIGLYGLLAATVTGRTREVGLRMALGANRRDVIALVVRQTLGCVALGLAIGLPAALGLGRYLRSQLFGLEPHDPWVLASAALAICVSALAATYLPARRAARVDPMTALRHE